MGTGWRRSSGGVPRRRRAQAAGEPGRARSGPRYLLSMAAMTACLGAILARLLFVQGIDSARYAEIARSSTSTRSPSWGSGAPFWTATATNWPCPCP